ncbi:thioesterase II family protein [Streptomyces macrosporus]|uniref:Alpha/beta fold hydrolase n=1 Tax=Streptomyces macrosporus TaxID=44032 RepID=A0ABN3KHV6_9ACTN
MTAPEPLHRLRAGWSETAPAAAGVTCLLLHHSGGSAASFVEFARHLPAHWEVQAVELPGRGRSFGERPCRSMDETVDLLARALEENRRDYVLFGHSLGGLIAYELTREMERLGKPPRWLGVSGCGSPDVLCDEPRERRDLWDSERLTDFLRSLGGTPEEVLRVPEMVDYLVGVLRWDLGIMDSYRHRPGASMTTAVSVFGGMSDPVVPERAIRGWREFTGPDTRLHMWPGGHFYLFERMAEVAAVIGRDTADAMRLTYSGEKRRTDKHGCD